MNIVDTHRRHITSIHRIKTDSTIRPDPGPEQPRRRQP